MREKNELEDAMEREGRLKILKRLTSIGDGIPSIKGLHGREGLEGNTLAEHTGEVDPGSLDKVSSGGKHSNAGVLELSGTEPGQSLIRSQGGKAKGVELLEGHGASRQAIKSHAKSSGRSHLRGRGERSSRASKSKEKTGNLHRDIYFCTTREK
jgi:hypothetical protein